MCVSVNVSVSVCVKAGVSVCVGVTACYLIDKTGEKVIGVAGETK